MKYDMFLLLLILIFTDKKEMSFIFTNIAFIVKKYVFTYLFLDSVLRCQWFETSI